MPVLPSHVRRGLHRPAAGAVRLLAAGAILLVACAAGCGGSGQGPDGRTDPASASTPAKTAGPGGGSEAPDSARRPGAAAPPVPASEGGSVAMPEDGGGKPARSVLLVTVDTLRADRLGCYGATSPATPAFDRIAREGTTFENAVATNPLTLPSHVSMLTGRYPEQHGVRGNGNFALPSGERTLATLLSDAGFETAAFVGAFPLAYRFGLGRGFKVYDDDFGSMDTPAGRRVASLGAARPGGQRARPRLALRAPPGPVLSLGPLLRSALRVRARGAVRLAVRRLALRRRSRRHRRRPRRGSRGPRPPRTCRIDGRPGRRGPRGGARRSRRGVPRGLSVRRDDPHSLPRPRPRPRAGGKASRRPDQRSRRGPDGAAASGGIRRFPRS